MERWELALGSLYEPVDKLETSGGSANWLIYDKLGKRVCLLKQRGLAAKAVYEKLKDMKNPHLPEIYRLVELDGKLWVIEEYIEGSTLAEKLEQERCLEEKLALYILKELCTCLGHLHDVEIIHRDIKPANIMLTKTGQVKLIDFGIARQTKEGGASDTESLGTKGYAPPEQYGFGQTDARSDIYSLGVTLQRMLGKDYRGVLKGVIVRCTALDPADRYGCVEEIMADLSRRQRGRALKRKTAAAALMLASLLSIFLWQQQAAEEMPPVQEVVVVEDSQKEDEAAQPVTADSPSLPEPESMEKEQGNPMVKESSVEPPSEKATSTFTYPFLQRSQCTFYLNGSPFEEGLGIPAAIWQNWAGNEESRAFPDEWTLNLHIENESAADFVSPRLEITYDREVASQTLPTIPSGAARDIAIPLGGRNIRGRLCNMGVQLEDAGGTSMYWNFQFYLER